MEFANNLLESRTFERHPISVCLGGFSMDKSGICKQSFRISNIRTPSKLGLFGGGGGISMDKSGICKQSFRVSNIRTPSKLLQVT